MTITTLLFSAVLALAPLSASAGLGPYASQNCGDIRYNAKGQPVAVPCQVGEEPSGSRGNVDDEAGEHRPMDNSRDEATSSQTDE